MIIQALLFSTFALSGRPSTVKVEVSPPAVCIEAMRKSLKAYLVVHPQPLPAEHIFWSYNASSYTEHCECGDCATNAVLCGPGECPVPASYYRCKAEQAERLEAVRAEEARMQQELDEAIAAVVAQCGDYLK